MIAATIWAVTVNNREFLVFQDTPTAREWVFDVKEDAAGESIGGFSFARDGAGVMFSNASGPKPRLQELLDVGNRFKAMVDGGEVDLE